MRTLGFRARGEVKGLLARFGVDIRRVRSLAETRPVGEMQATLEGFRQRGLHCSTVLDVGANRGDWARMALRVWPDANVVLVEPDQEMARRLEALCRAHPGSRCFQAAAGARQAHQPLAVFSDLVGSTLLPTDGDPAVVERRSVRVLPVDSLFGDGVLVPELAKLDVQGYELEVLRGASRLLGKTEVFVIETSLFEFREGQPTFRQVWDFMQQQGYELDDLAGFARRPSDGALAQVDACFAKSDGILRQSSAW